VNPLDFISLVLDHVALVAVLSVGLTLLLYFATRRVAGDIADPFHFFYSFTYGTAYAVVGLLAYTGHLTTVAISVVAGYGSLFLIGYTVFSRVSFFGFGRARRISMGGRALFLLAILLYCIIAAVFLKQVGFAAFLPSRFQIGRYNLLAIIMDPLRLFIAGYLALQIFNCQGRNRKILLSCAELAFILLSSLINGSKLSFLESVYAGAVAIVISRRGVPIPWKRVAKPILLVLTISIVYAVSQQYFNLEASGGTEDKQSYALYTKGPLLLDLFAMRIVNNGDIYYYALPEPVFHNIVIDHPFALLFGDVFGGQLLGALFGVDLSRSVDVSHQAMGYWYGTYNGDVGPADHFDMDAYKFFGPVGGIVFVLGLALVIAGVNSLKRGHYDSAGCAVIAAVYIRSLIMLLSPHVGLAYMEESMLLFGVLAILARALNYAVSPNSPGSGDFSLPRK
jgi:hypothetical protein